MPEARSATGHDLTEGAHTEIGRGPKLADRVVTILGARLVHSGEDSSMPSEGEIAKAFGVSRTVAREVVQTLARLGMVDVSQGKRMQVRPQSEWDYLSPVALGFFDDQDVVRRILTELHETRVLIEPAVAARAAVLATDEERAAMSDEVEAMRALLDDADQFVMHDVTFHTLLAQASRNRFIRRIVETSRELLLVAQLETTVDPDILPLSLSGHEKILRGVLDRSPESASAAMEEHLALGTARFWLGADVVPIAPEWRAR